MGAVLLEIMRAIPCSICARLRAISPSQNVVCPNARCDSRRRGGVAHTLGQGEELLPKLLRGLELPRAL